MALLALAGWCGLPRAGELLFPGPALGSSAFPGWLALACWLLTLGLLLRWLWPGKRVAPRSGQGLGGRFLSQPAAVVGLVGASVLLLASLLAPMLATSDPLAAHVVEPLRAPGPGCWLGLDAVGRDLLARSLHGARLSLSVGVLATALAASLGLGLGVLAGYRGGRADAAIMWCADLLLALPRLVLLLGIIGIFRLAGSQSLLLLMVILGLTGWMSAARVTRAEVRGLKGRSFVMAARALGLPTWRLLWRHLLPNVLGPVLVYVTMGLGSTILVEAALSFLGLGVPIPHPSWGSIVADGRHLLLSAWWVSTIPGLFILSAVSCCNLVGEGLRKAMDPRFHG